MKRLAAVLVLALAAAVLPSSGPAAAERYEWFWSNDARSVLMQETDPSASDLYLHFKFKRYGGKGTREVRIRERGKKPVTAWYTHPAVKLDKGEKAVFTTRNRLSCEPASTPVQYELQMRVKMPGKKREPWTVWVGGATYLLDCDENP